MKHETRSKSAALLALAIMCSAAFSTPALAQHRGHGGYGGGHGPRAHFGFGVYIGGPVFSPWYYPPPYAYYPRPIYYPAPVVVAPQPQVYIEQAPAMPATPAESAAPPAASAAPQESQSWWYYCGESKTYYPYVQTCPGGWQRVSPQPPAS